MQPLRFVCLPTVLLSAMFCLLLCGCNAANQSASTPITTTQPPPTAGLAGGSWTITITEADEQTTTLTVTLVQTSVITNSAGQVVCQVQTADEYVEVNALSSSSCFEAINDGSQSQGSLTTSGNGFHYPYQSILVVANPVAAPSNPAPISMVFTDNQLGVGQGGAYREFLAVEPNDGTPGMLNGTATSGTSITGGTGEWFCNTSNSTCSSSSGNGTFSGDIS